MKKIILSLFACLMANFVMASSVFYDSFEYANHDGEVPVGWICDNDSWVCGYLEKDHNRIAHHGNWYVYTNADESWMFMPQFMTPELKYRYSFWAISDGSYIVEIWAGNAPDIESMTALLYTENINANSYEQFSKYIESLDDEYEYFGIHAIAGNDAYYLTVDEFNIDLVGKYDIIALPTIADTVLYPESQASHHIEVQNLGYEPITVLFNPTSEYFGNYHYYVEGNACSSFHLEPDETKPVVIEATLLPTVPVGTRCWFDIILKLDCDCATTMTTLWATIIEPAGIEEYKEEEKTQVELFDLTGKRVDPSQLKAGIYIERTITSQGISTKKFIKN